MRELEMNFSGKGEVRGFMFRQVAKSERGYIYEVTHPDVVTPHYEVFKRRVNHRFGLISYPRAKAFGRWAWTYNDLCSAKNKLYSI